MRKILLTIIGLALASTAWSAQAPVALDMSTKDSVGALKKATNTALGIVEANRLDHEARVAAMETGKAAVSCFANSTAFNACFTLDWQTGFDVAANYTVTGSWDFTGATVTGLGTATLPSATEGQILQADSSGVYQSVSEIAGLINDDCLAAGNCGLDDILPASQVVTALGGKQDSLSLPSQAEAEAGTETTARSWSAERVRQAITANAGGGSFAFDTFPIYEDSAHSSKIAFDGATGTLAIYDSATSKWMLSAAGAFTDTLAATPITYAATLTITDASATGDTFTLNSIAYDVADSPVSVTDLPTATEQITYTGSNTANCTGDVAGTADTGPWTINADPATVACTVTIAPAYTTYFSNDFNCADGDYSTIIGACTTPNPWNSITGTISSISGGNLVITHVASTSTSNLISPDLTPHGDVELILNDMTPNSVSPQASMTIAQLRSGANQLFSITMYKTTTGYDKWRLTYRNETNVATSLDTDFTFQSGHSYDIRLTAKCSSSTSSANGAISLYVSDNGGEEVLVAAYDNLNTFYPTVSKVYLDATPFSTTTNTITYGGVVLGYK